MGAINSYPSYRSFFGFPIDGGTPSTGIVYAIYTIGNLVGSFAAGPATDFRGMLTLVFRLSYLLMKYRSSLWYVHWCLLHHSRYMYSSSCHQSCHVHGRTVCSWFRCGYLCIIWPCLCFGNGTSILPWYYDWPVCYPYSEVTGVCIATNISSQIQHLLVHWWHPRHICALRNIYNIRQQFMENSHLASDDIRWYCSDLLLVSARGKLLPAPPQHLLTLIPDTKMAHGKWTQRRSTRSHG